MKMILMVSLGAIIGALIRHSLSSLFNGMITHVAVGTLIANVIGSLLIGIALAAVISYPNMSNEWRGLIITGFLGSLTTFSSFAGEVVTKIQASKYFEAFAVVGLHLGLGIIATAVGFWLWEVFNGH